MGVKIGLRRDEKGFTGLEAAIVLIAFVVVAAVFSYVMLGAGFFTTQKSKQVVDTGVKQASSSLTLDGQYIYLNASENAGGKTGSNGKVGAIFFYVTQTAGGSPVDLEKTSIAITTASGYKQVFFKPLIAK
ncbi:MAG: archaellin/type IV pilin N-terminal domain-containing protein, partial [Archaeoglobaceae archaeon]